jgi:hypothetical protein
MSDNYKKVGKLFNLNQSNGTSAISIDDASFIHGIYAQHTGPITVTIDGTYSITLGSYQHADFSNPVAFSTVKIDTNAGHAAVILYS